MKLEEVIEYLVDEKYSFLEKRDVHGDNRSDWYSVTKYILDNSLRTFLHSEFRLKKEKVKRYQVLYTDFGDGVDFYVTPPKLQKYKNRQDFDQCTFCESKRFVCLILESEEEFEE